jgi:hypothetical protein
MFFRYRKNQKEKKSSISDTHCKKSFGRKERKGEAYFLQLLQTQEKAV